MALDIYQPTEADKTNEVWMEEIAKQDATFKKEDKKRRKAKRKKNFASNIKNVLSGKADTFLGKATTKINDFVQGLSKPTVEVKMEKNLMVFIVISVGGLLLWLFTKKK